MAGSPKYKVYDENYAAYIERVRAMPVSATGDVHEGCGGIWQDHPTIPHYADQCDKCGEERA